MSSQGRPTEVDPVQQLASSPRTYLHCFDTRFFVGNAINKRFFTSWATQQFMDGNTEALARYIPKCLINAGGDSRLDRTATVKSAAVYGLPVVNNRTWILADQVVPDFERPGGTGLGLALSRHFVARHGGSIQVRPRAPKGTRVRVILPLRRPA